MATINNGQIALTGGVINLAEKASPKVVEAFSRESCTEGLFSHDYDWTGVRTVRVYSVDDLPLNDYNQTKVDGTSRFGTLVELGDTVQEMTVNQDKAFNGIIDKANNTSVLMIKAAGKVLSRQMKNVVVPYVDKFRLGVLAAGSGLTKGSGALSKTDIIEKIMTGNAAMSNELVPDTGRVMFIGYTEAIKLKLADQVVGIDKLGEESIVNGVCGKIDKCQVRIVPDSYMPTVDVSSTSTPSLKAVKFMIVKTGVALAPKKIETYRVVSNSYIVDGSIVQGRLLHDCFVLTKKNKGIYVYTEA